MFHLITNVTWVYWYHPEVMDNLVTCAYVIAMTNIKQNTYLFYILNRDVITIHPFSLENVSLKYLMAHNSSIVYLLFAALSVLMEVFVQECEG